MKTKINRKHNRRSNTFRSRPRRWKAARRWKRPVRATSTLRVVGCGAAAGTRGGRAVWVEYRTDWVWVPARYQWTPAGYVFCDGYWDYPLARRGVLFAPVAFAQPIYTRPAFVYTPVYVVSEPCMFGALFVRRGCNHYYFGDYFDNRYAFRGYSAWCGFYTRNGFSIGFGTGRRWGYDPLWSYYSVTYRNTPTWRRGVGELYTGRYRGDGSPADNAPCTRTRPSTTSPGRTSGT